MTDEPADELGADDASPLTRAEARRAAQDESSALHSHVRAARSEFEHQIVKARADFEQVNDRINARTGRNLLLATLIGLAIGAAVLGSLLWVKWLFLLFAIPVCLLGVFEFSRALQTAGRRVDLWPQLAMGAVIMVAGFAEGHWTHWVTTFAAVAFLIVWRMLAQMSARDGRRYGDVVSDVLVAGFIPLYVPFLASLTLVLLRQDGGEFWLLAMIVVVVVADTGAYASGLAFGRHPMAPRISPKKTWEGFAGAAVVAIGSGVALALLLLHVPWWAGVLFGVVILASATVGDLGESMIKRDLGIKDMSSWLPGHGGVLDRLDSILPSAAAALAMSFLLAPLATS
ncbi:MAG: phosphatidate cytidylyltransferase [Candidatus Microbacterium phytovorans]|uniref:Phosphatidate cytidylyltransferase n=1 Tax=Candidatus Microbacterium phytovorans TaxID=3121374 RepID=A0AAJ6B4V9_9MICO|nr:phosphatidate cytidylyltransferase [Microbacterium sp.]WEK14524.1 MAG: phosphatidate cytidylyltransferase [Microbacterium sp.]